MIDPVVQPFISIGVWEIIATLLNTLILYLIVKKLFFKKVSDMIKKREEDVSSLYFEAESAKTSAEQMQREYTKKLNDAKSEATDIVKNAQKIANTKSEEILSKAKEDAQYTIKKAENTIANEKQKAKSELKNEISSMAILLASHVLEKEINQEDHNMLIDNFIKTVGDA